MATREMTREELIRELKRFEELYSKAAEELEQERVQHAGCLVAAEGATDPEHTAKKGDYGWSLAYETTLSLRLRHDRLERVIKEAMDNLGVPQPGYPMPVAVAYDLLKDALDGK